MVNPMPAKKTYAYYPKLTPAGNFAQPKRTLKPRKQTDTQKKPSY
jgi:hypothetical protein